MGSQCFSQWLGTHRSKHTPPNERYEGIGVPDKRLHVHGRRAHQTNQLVVLPKGYFLIWLLRLLFLQFWVNRGHELAQLLQVLLVNVQFGERFTDPQQLLFARGLQWAEDFHVAHVGYELIVHQ